MFCRDCGEAVRLTDFGLLVEQVIMWSQQERKIVQRRDTGVVVCGKCRYPTNQGELL